MPWTVSWRIIVDGRDMTAGMHPYLMSIQVDDKDGSSGDTCSLEFDDAGGQIKLPAAGASVQVSLQGVQVFDGTVDTVTSTGTRGGGRILKVDSKGFDARGKVKEPQAFHLDDAPLSDFLGKAAQLGGLSGIIVDPALAGIVRDYWSADRESFLHLGQRLAREFNATFKLRGDTAVIVPRDKDHGLPAVKGDVGRNVISWSITPVTGRRVFTKAKVSYFDRQAAAFKSEDMTIEGTSDLPAAVNAVRTTAADAAGAKARAQARGGESKREGGKGTVELDLTVEAQAEAPFELAGARPGVDGAYRIVSVTHRANRSGGATTSLELKQPSGDAGKDARRPTGETSSDAGGTASGADAETGAAGRGGGGEPPVLDLPGDGPE